MLNKTLKVKIPKKFKKQLIARFSVSNAKKISNKYQINISCPLCKVYKGIVYYECSTFCPFSNLQGLIGNGCIHWIRKLLNMRGICNIITFGEDELYWHLENDKQARKLLKKLKTQAKKYIEWV